MLRALLRAAPVWGLIVLTGLPASSQELRLGLGAGIGGESNVQRTATNPIADGFIDLSPTIAVEDGSGAFTYDVHYKPTYEAFFTQKNASGWDQFTYGQFDWQLEAQDHLTLKPLYYDRRAVQSEFIDQGASAPQLVLTDRARIKSFQADLDFDHSFSPRMTGTFQGAVRTFNYEVAAFVPSASGGGDLGLNYALDPLTVVGANLGATYQAFQETGQIPASSTQVYRAGVFLQRALTPKTVLAIRGGPSYVRSSQQSATDRYVDRFSQSPTDPAQIALFFACGTAQGRPVLYGCPIFEVPPLGTPIDEQVYATFAPGTNLAGSSESRVTYFADISLTRTLREGRLVLTYTRSQDTGSGLGVSTTFDNVTATLIRKIDPKWSFNISLNWNRRKSISTQAFTYLEAVPSAIVDSGGIPFAEAGQLFSVPVQRNVDIQQVRVNAALRRRLGRRTFILARYLYVAQQCQISSCNFFDTHKGSIDFQYEFDAFRF